MASSRIPLGQLANVCRSLSTSLSAGVPILKAFDLASRKAPGQLGRMLADVVTSLKTGEDVTSSLRAHGEAFPPLMVDMLSVGEQSGALPEVLKSLAQHYENTLRLKRDFIGQMIGPVIRLVAAVHIIALLIYILGMVGDGQTDMLGWGLLGTSGVMVWLGGWYIGTVAAIIGYKVITSSLSGKFVLHRLLMAIPVVGGCMRDFAIARFSWAFALTQEAGLPVDESLEASLKATANGVFINAKTQIVGDVMSGETLTSAFDRSGLFPAEYVQIVEVGETSGTVPETLDRLSPQFEDKARRSLRALAEALGWLVWIIVAGFIIFVIFTIALQYIGMINDNLPR
jgi:type IV pilus assembly protein PilC